MRIIYSVWQEEVADAGHSLLYLYIKMKILIFALLCFTLALDQHQTPTASQQPSKEPQIKLLQQQLPSQNTPNAAKELISDLRKPTKLALNDILPSPASSKVIEYSLWGTLILFAVLQISSLFFGKKKKRYGQKFEEYSQRGEIEELQESTD